MAQFKASMPVVAKRTPSEKAETTFSDGLKLAKMMSVGVTPTKSDVVLYGDDDVAEKDSQITNYAISLNTTYLPTAAMPILFGSTHKAAAEGSPEEVVYKEGDEAPEVGFGYIDAHKMDGVTKYRVVWMPRVQFTLPAETSTTKGETTSFATPSITGTAKKDNFSKELKHDYYFDDAEAAVAKLKTLAGIK